MKIDQRKFTPFNSLQRPFNKGDWFYRKRKTKSLWQILASKEARETLYWLKLLEKAELVSGDRLQDLKQEADEIVRILTSIVKSTRD